MTGRFTVEMEGLVKYFQLGSAICVALFSTRLRMFLNSET